MKSLAQINLSPAGGFTGFGKLGTPGATGISLFAGMISTTIGVLTIVAIIWFVFNFIMGAIGVISSGGDKQKLESARNKVTYSVIGIVAVIAAIFVVELIGFLLGFPNILDLNALFTAVAGKAGGSGAPLKTFTI